MNGGAFLGVLLYLARKWVCLGLLSFWGVVLTTSAMAQPEISLTANGIRGVEILDRGNIPTSLTAAMSGSQLRSMLPYVVVVRNTGSLPITGLDVRYVLITKGDEVVKNFFYGSPGDMADPASFPVIAPGKSAVISPDHLANEQIMSWGVLTPLSDKHIAAMGRTIDDLNRADRIMICVDSVIRSDGVIVGPDRARRFRSFQQQIIGYTEFRDQLLKRFSEGESDDSVISWLMQIANQQVMRPGKNEPLDRGVILLKSLAQQYLALMQKGQRQDCWDILNQATPAVKLRQIIKVRQEVQS